MYTVGKQTHKHRKGRKHLLRFLVLLGFGALVWWLMHLTITPNQEIYNSAPISKSYNAAQKQLFKIDKPLFSMELPDGWKENIIEPSPYAPKYRFSNPAKANGGQMVELYIDTVPTNIAVNKVLVVEPAENGLTHDQVSENCTTFTESELTNHTTGTAPARWQGINFICDMGNYARQVVGIASTEGVNRVTVTGATKGAHKLFILYTDNNITPDYNILYDALNSLKFK